MTPSRVRARGERCSSVTQVSSAFADEARNAPKLMMTLFSALLLSNAAHAATLTVGPSGTYADISSAVSAAASGDTIEVAPGTYTENIDLSGKDLDIVATSGPAVTTISPATSGFAVVVASKAVGPMPLVVD